MSYYLNIVVHNNSIINSKGYISCTNEYVLYVMCVVHHLVCRRGIGREIHKNGSKVLLCLRQWGHVREDLEGERKTSENLDFNFFCLFKKIKDDLSTSYMYTLIIMMKYHYIIFILHSFSHYYPALLHFRPFPHQPVAVTKLTSFKYFKDNGH